MMKTTRVFTKFKTFLLSAFFLTSMYYIVSINDGRGSNFYMGIRNSFNSDVHEESSKTLQQEQQRIEGITTTTGTITQLSESNAVNNETGLTLSTAPDEFKELIGILKGTANKFFELISSKAFSTNSKISEKERILLALSNQEALIQEEMKNYAFDQSSTASNLSDLLMNHNGQPIRNVIFTTWRSGSTFLGEVITSHPAMFYHYEPLLHFDIVQVRSGELANEGHRVIKSLLECDYSNLQKYVEYGKDHVWLHSHNWRLWQYCKQAKEFCLDPKFLSDVCRLFPFQIMKTVRMRLKLAEVLLQDERLDLRVLFLVRDPRGTLQSRKHREWCPPSPDCSDPFLLCSDLVEDYHAAVTFREKYPTKIMIIRYEDISLNPYSGVKKVLKFLRLGYHSTIDNFIKTHTVKTHGGVSSTFRDSKSTPFQWIENFQNNSKELIQIQTDCQEAMKLWGYAPISSETSFKKTHPLLKPPWADMIIPNDSTALAKHN